MYQLTKFEGGLQLLHMLPTTRNTAIRALA